MSKHTVGPWSVFDPKTTGQTYGIDGNDGTAVVFYGSTRINGIPSLDDARLIAAAPDMLQMLQDIRHFLKSSGYDTRLVDATIAKATGGAA